MNPYTVTVRGGTAISFHVANLSARQAMLIASVVALLTDPRHRAVADAIARGECAVTLGPDGCLAHLLGAEDFEAAPDPGGFDPDNPDWWKHA